MRRLRVCASGDPATVDSSSVPCERTRLQLDTRQSRIDVLDIEVEQPERIGSSAGLVNMPPSVKPPEENN